MFPTLKLHWAGSALALTQTPRAAGANKGNFGHVLVVGGSIWLGGRQSGRAGHGVAGGAAGLERGW